MRPTLTRTALVLGPLAVLVGAPSSAAAQLGISRSDQSVLVLWPNPAKPSDSTFAIQIGDQLRDKLDTKERFKMRVWTRPRICEILGNSGFHCPELLDPENADRLAGFMKTDAYIYSVFTRNSKPTLHIRMVDLKRTGISGWITVVGDTNWKADQFADAAVDSIDKALGAAEDAHDCYDKLDHNDVKGAREKVVDAFKASPNQPSAALCLARSFEASNQPADSIIYAYTRAAKGDSLNGRVWDRLAEAYMRKNDTKNAVEARAHQLEVQPHNAQLRKAVAAGLIDLKDVQRGVAVIDVGLQDNPLDVDLLRMKQQACVDAQMWKCALGALSSLFEADTVVRGDSVFFAKIFGAAQSLNDTAAMLKWSGEAVKHVPNSLTMWRARAAALSTAGRTDSAVMAYQKVLERDSSDVNVMLTVARGLAEGLSGDSVTPLDTARVRTIDHYLTRASTLAKDSSMQSLVAVLYFTTATHAIRTHKNDALSDSLLSKALAKGLKSPYVEPASWILGTHVFRALQATPTYNEQIQKLGRPTPPRALTAAEDAKGCQLLSEELAIVDKAKPLITAGQSASNGLAPRLLAYLGQIEGQAPAIKKFFKCH